MIWLDWVFGSPAQSGVLRGAYPRAMKEVHGFQPKDHAVHTGYRTTRLFEVIFAKVFFERQIQRIQWPNRGIFSSLDNAGFSRLKSQG